MNWRTLAALALVLLAPRSALGGGLVCASALNLEPVGTYTFAKTRVETANEDYWYGTNTTASYLVFEGGIIPPGSGFTVAGRAWFYTGDTSGTDSCCFTFAALSKTLHCVGGSNPGAPCKRVSAATDCGGGGTCTGGVPDETLLVVGTDLTTICATQAYVSSIQEYSTDWSATTIVQYHSGGGDAACTDSKCNDEDAKLFVVNYASGSTATDCRLKKVCWRFD